MIIARLRRSSLDQSIDALRSLLRSGYTAADMDRKAAAINGTDRRTDGHPTVTQNLYRRIRERRHICTVKVVPRRASWSEQVFV